MSSTVLNPAHVPIVRIHTRECEKPYADHSCCPGIIRQTGVTFVCQCECHRRLPLFEGAPA
ncbi:MAG: hypothetical protein ACJ71S_06435 [Acidobacteriaceae bacterium]|jgi:hypothetical protein